ncbi:MAG: serine hydrolase domain-containing protein [Kibdelosporangium sp.]
MDSIHLSGIFGKLVQKYQVPGAQLAFYGDGELKTVEVGHQQHGMSGPVTSRSAFPFGSVTKFVTATVAMQFVSDGDIDLDEPVGKYAPELSGGAFREVTLRQLLSHTAGLVTEVDCPEMRTSSFQKYAQAAARFDGIFPPGTAFSYSNVGYGVAAYLIERVSGMDWWSAVETCLLRPLGIEPAFLHDPRPSAPRASIVAGHTVRLGDGTIKVVDLFLPLSASGAGGLAGSAADLVTIACMHMSDQSRFDNADLLPLEAAREMQATVPGADPFGLADEWGLGMMKYRAGERMWYGHDGTVDGTTCHLRIDPVDDIAFAMTANGTTGMLLWDELVTSLRNEGMEIGHYAPAVPDQAMDVDPADYLGDYTNGDFTFVVSEEDNSGMALSRKDGFHVKLKIHEGDVFATVEEEIDAHAVHGQFVRDQINGAVTLLQYGGRSYRRT